MKLNIQHFKDQQQTEMPPELSYFDGISV